MSPNRHTFTTPILSVVLAVICVLISLLAWQSWSYFRLYLESAFAEEQTRIFEDCREKALLSNAAGAAFWLDQVFIYYPSGSKQRTGSHLDHVVERHRLAVAREIIAHLRRVTGQDLGDKPEPWVKKYTKNE